MSGINGGDLCQDGEALIGIQFFETDRERGTGPIVIGNQRAIARAVRVGLPHANLARLRAMRSHAYFVILDLTMLRIAQ